MAYSQLDPDEMRAIRAVQKRFRLGLETFSQEAALFRAAFIFINLYAIVFISTSTLFPDLVFYSGTLETLKADYGQLLRVRTLIALGAITALDLAYFFRFKFRAAAVFTLIMTTYYSIDMFVMYGGFIVDSRNIFVAVFFFARPLLIASLYYIVSRNRD